MVIVPYADAQRARQFLARRLEASKRIAVAERQHTVLTDPLND